MRRKWNFRWWIGAAAHNRNTDQYTIKASTKARDQKFALKTNDKESFEIDASTAMKTDYLILLQVKICLRT